MIRSNPKSVLGTCPGFISSLWISFLFVLSLVGGLGAESARIDTHGRHQYVEIRDFLKTFPELRYQWNQPIYLVQLESPNGKKLRFRTSSTFYFVDGEIIKITKKPIFSQERVFLPPDLVEAILIHLIDYEVFYQYQDKFLSLEVRSRDAGPGFLPIRAIVIDAGHGGKDPGTSDRKGTTEKSIALSVALHLVEALQKTYPQMIVQMTRGSDQFISLEDRSKFANRLLSDTKDIVFVSLHCNFSLSDKPRGYEIYYLSQTPTTEQSREISILENKILGTQTGEPIRSIQAGMMSSLVQRRSKVFAESLDLEFSRNFGNLIPSRGVKKADFAVLRGSLMPAVLIEMGFLSHPQESIYLNSEKVQKKIAESIVRGIQSYGERKDG